MGLGHALLVRTEIGIIGTLFWEQTHLGLIRSAEPQVCLGPWNCNISDIQQIWQKERARQRLRSSDSWKVPLSLCPDLSSGSITETSREISPNLSVDARFMLGVAQLDCSQTPLLWNFSKVRQHSKWCRLPHTCLLPQISGPVGCLVLTIASTTQISHFPLHFACDLCQVTTCVS